MSELVHRVLWGDLDLTEPPFALAFGADWGGPQPVSEVIESLLQDGEIEVSDRDANRSLAFTVYVEGADMLDLAESAENLLLAEARKQRNEITLHPGDGYGPGYTIRTFRATPSNPRDEDAERQGLRRFDFTVPARPFVRSLDSVTIEAVASGGSVPSPNEVLVDGCTSAANWSRTTSPGTGSSGTATGPTVSSSAIRAAFTWTGPEGRGIVTTRVRLTRTGLSADMSSTTLLKVDTSAESPAATSMTFEINGSPATPIAQADGTFWFDCRDIATVTDFAAEVTSLVYRQQQPAPWTVALKVHNIWRTNITPIIGTGRQQFRTAPVLGSARTEGSIVVAHETQALGDDVMLYTIPADGSGHQPACRQYRTSGPTSPTTGGGAADTASGAWESIAGGPVVFDVPARTVPTGSYAILARLRSAVAGYKSVTARAGVLLGATSLPAWESTTTPNLGTTWGLTELGSVSLPPIGLPVNSTGFVRLEIESTDDVQIDELYICNLTAGALTIVSCGTGTPAAGGASSRLWVDTASLDVPHPSIWVGTQSDRSDARHASDYLAEMPHQLPPGLLNVFALSSNAVLPAVSLEYFPQWHFHSAR